ncbi:TolC family protein, partial [Thermodesulfobacteriota bacterium]
MRIKLLHSLLILILLSAAWIQHASAQTSSSEELSLRSFVEEALKNSPKIKEARYRWGAAVEKVSHVSTLPNPMISYTYFPDPIETRLGPNTSRFMLSQMVPYPSKLSAKADIASHDAVMESYRYQKDVRDVITKLSLSYFELLYIDKAIDIIKQNRKILELLVKIGSADYASDATTLSDVLTAQSQLAQLNYDYILLQELRETEAGKIVSILNRPPAESIGRVKDARVEFGYEIGELYDISKSNQEELKIIDSMIEKERSAEDLAKLSYYPDFNLSLVYSKIDNPPPMTPDGMLVDDAGKDSYGVTIGISLPIWYGKNSSRVKEKSFKRREMIEKRNVRINDTNAKLKELYFKLNNAKRLMELYTSTLIPQAETTMAKAKEFYEQKQSSYSQLLETQSVWLNF